jgi:hypothetical protein
LVFYLVNHVRAQREDSLLNVRSFYGVLHVLDFNPGSETHMRSLLNGRITHGSQFLGRGEMVAAMPTTYFGINSGIGLIFRLHPHRLYRGGMKVGVVGLGIGTIAAYIRNVDEIRFYEINPNVLNIAESYFSYLKPTKSIEVVLGDARVMLQQELDQQGSQEFDILVVDAFSGDSIPIHLLTEEAMELYWQHLAADGVLALHLTNFHLDLLDVARNLASHVDKKAFWVQDEGNIPGEAGNDWVIVTNNRALIGNPAFQGSVSQWSSAQPEPITWTDNFGNLFEVVIWE